MNIRQLSIFINVAKNLNVTKTAKEMYLAQPSVSQAIKELESEYNVKLFKRVKQRLILTEAGKDLVRCAKQIINDVTLFEAKANNLSNKPKLNLACSLSMGENYLAELISNYEAKTNFSFHFNVIISSKIIAGILNGDFDLGIIEAEANNLNLVSLKLRDDKLVVIAGKNYAIQPTISLAELIKYPLILRDQFSGTRLFVDNLLQSRGLSYNPYCEASTNLSVIDFVSHNLGVGIVPDSVATNFLASKELKKIKIVDADLTRAFNLIYLKSHVVTAEEQKLINYFVAKLSPNKL